MGTNIAIGNLVGKFSTAVQQTDFPFSDSLVDYWNFRGKNNLDIDRNVIKGVNGNIITAYNFGWSLMSGYGGYNENYLTYFKSPRVFVTDDHSITIMNFVQPNVYAVYKSSITHIKATRIKVTGLTAPDQLTYEYSPSDGGSRVVFPIPEDGEYDLPESIRSSSVDARYTVGFAVRSALTKDVVIEQIPLYPGAIVTDGIDDYLKLDKVGYNIGTIILKYIPITINSSYWNTVFDCMKYSGKNRLFLAYISGSEYAGVSLAKTQVGEYRALKDNANKIFNVTEPLYLGASYNTSNITVDFLSMALYSIAIYDRVLSDQEVQKVINFMNKDNKS